MTEATKNYTKIRRDFGKPVYFEDGDVKIQISIEPKPHKLHPPSGEEPTFCQRDPIKAYFHNIPKMTEHSVSSAQFE
jgi:hypothetical protein